MIEFNDTIDYKEFWFDGEKYVELQKNQILDRMVNTAWRLYLEIWWNILKDTGAQRILPWYSIDSMKKIFSSNELKDKIEILYCINSEDIIQNKKVEWSNLELWEYIEHKLMVIERTFWVKPVIVITNIDVWNMFDLILNFERKFQKKQYRVFERYKISWYPYNLKSMLSEDWFGADDHIPLFKNLVLVTWFWSNNGKFSTCLWQIYLDNEIWIRAGYAKFQTLPVWNFPINHPINIVCQCYCLDSDYELILDTLHKKTYNQDAISINKDLESFEILQWFAKQAVNHKNYIIKYNSAIDACINCTWMCISNEDIVVKSCLQEIQTIKDLYQKMWKTDLVDKCNELYDLAKQRKK